MTEHRLGGAGGSPCWCFTAASVRTRKEGKLSHRHQGFGDYSSGQLKLRGQGPHPVQTALEASSSVLSAAAFMSNGFKESLLMLAEVTFCCHLDPGRYPLGNSLPWGEAAGDVVISFVTSDRFSSSSCWWYWEWSLGPHT